jgi:ERCC4-type nuclease
MPGTATVQLDRTIYVDNRVGSKELISHISNTTQLTRLEYGDVFWLGHGPDGPCTVCVERKTIGDLVSSIDSGRLSGHQLLGMLNSYDYVYLLVEGIWHSGDEGILERYVRGRWRPLVYGNRQYMAREVENYLNTLAVTCGVHVWRTQTIGDTGSWIDHTHSWWSKPWDHHQSHRQFRVDVPPSQGALLRRPSLLRRCLKEFDGVGWGKSKDLAARYHNLYEFAMEVQEAELRKVPGIGKILADKIMRQIHGIQ